MQARLCRLFLGLVLCCSLVPVAGTAAWGGEAADERPASGQAFEHEAWPDDGCPDVPDAAGGADAAGDALGEDAAGGAGSDAGDGQGAEAFEPGLPGPGQELPGLPELPGPESPGLPEALGDSGTPEADGGALAEGDEPTSFELELTALSHSIDYRAHVAAIGWQNWVKDGGTAGTTGKARSIEALNIRFSGSALGGSVEYRTHVQNLGWQGWVRDGTLSGTTGRALRTEALNIRLTGSKAATYDIYYRVHAQNFGWLGWAKNGESAGTAGYGYRMEALQVKLVAKGGRAPGSTGGAFRQKSFVQSQMHVQNIGWQNPVADGATAGTTGRSLRIEGVRISLASPQYAGEVQYNAHVQNIGWQGWKSNGAVSGTTGRSLRLEAIQIRLTGEMANRFDIYYRVHAQNFGWLGWAKNGQSSGTAGYSYRLEALQVKLVAKGGAAPGFTSGAFRQKPVTTPIMGAAQTSIAQMVRRYQATGNRYPASEYKSKGAATLQDFCRIVYEEAVAEGVRPEVLFCQMMYETGWLQFGGAVKAWQCNFGGLGATNAIVDDKGVPVKGEVFKDVRRGTRAQVQHLKAYAVKGLKASDLKYPLADTRFDLVPKGSAPTLEALNGKWAVPGEGYGERIALMIKDLLKA
ncbi:MAG: glucosaminidase domain-containing protein [Coriobacteriaceae bacterium]|jgi:uncharacterized protein YjdB|nr:glucosaminidase domain-containing protein [Coriobacteriaceae bacterium]